MSSTADSAAIEQGYEELPYRLGVFPQTHPARMAAIAGLFGHPAPPPATARVLEVGCAQGYNTMHLAHALPGASFVGIDLSQTEIAEGRKLAAAAGIGNLRLECADLLDFQPGPGSFDYIIAHGIFSWLPDAVKEALLALCRRALSPGGVAYISYNTYPGWKQRESFRDLMLLRLRGVTGVDRRRAEATAVLDRLDTALAREKTATSHFLRETIATIKRKDPVVFYHDDLGAINDPCYFLQFADWAGEQGLQYLADAQFSTMFYENLPPQMHPSLESVRGDRMQTEQFMDFLRNCTFRRSLVCHREAPLNQSLDLSSLREFAFGANLRPPVGLPVLKEGHPVQFTGPRSVALQTKDPIIKAALTILADQWPRRVAFPELLSASERLLADTRTKIDAGQDLVERLAQCLLDGCCRGVIDFLTVCGVGCQPRVTARPTAAAFTRFCAQQKLPTVSRWHEMVTLDEPGQALLATLDGSRASFSQAEQATLERLAGMGLLKG